MADIELVIKIPEEIYKASQIIDAKYEDTVQIPLEVIANGVTLKKGHGRIVDIGKIDEDRIEKDNPVISLTVNGEYIEAVSLDYLNNLQTIIEADTESEEQFERSIITKTGMLDDNFWRTLELKHPLKDYQSESEDRGMANGEILETFYEKYPKIRVMDYRPLCPELFTKNLIGITIWLENGDIIQYYPKEAQAESEE